MANVDTYGSEGDAYRYTKKVLQTLPNSRLLESIYTEVAEKRGLSSWTRAAYVDLRATFFRAKSVHRAVRRLRPDAPCYA